MNNQIHICSVCHYQYNEGEYFCSICGFDLISIPNNSSQWLKNHYQKKTDWHKKNIEIHNSNIEQLELFKNEIKILKEENVLLTNQLNIDKKNNILISNQKQCCTTPDSIEWEMIGQLKFKFYSKSSQIKLIIPHKIILFLRKNEVPNLGDFNFAMMIDTADMINIDSHTCELSIRCNEIQYGEYFARLFDMEHNVYFYHKEQKNKSTFDWKITKINFKQNEL